jgi:hypothetical protein
MGAFATGFHKINQKKSGCRPQKNMGGCYPRKYQVASSKPLFRVQIKEAKVTKRNLFTLKIVLMLAKIYLIS